jgi:hypothetical protein
MSSFPSETSFDVAVIGAGSAGIAAATAAAKLGARTLILEKSAQLGGTTTTGGVNFPGLFHAWGKQVIAGVGWDLIQRCHAAGGATLPDFSRWDLPHWKLQIKVDRFIYLAVADEMVTEAGVKILFHCMPYRIERSGRGWAIDVAVKEGSSRIMARCVIDATGDANAVSLAGGATRTSDHLQPSTYVFRAGGYDPATLPYDLIAANWERAIKDGQVQPSDLGHHGPVTEGFLRKWGENTLHVTGINARTSAGKTETELAGRAAAFRLLKFFRQQPGLENFHYSWAAPECGVRETVTIDGEVEITEADYVSGRIWEDAVCHSFYPIDIHREDGNGIEIRPLKHGIIPTIPLRAMLPKNIPAFFAPGKHACGDKAAHSAYRVQATCFAMGEACGTAAALLAQSKMETAAIDLLEPIRKQLRVAGCIVPDHLGLDK